VHAAEVGARRRDDAKVQVVEEGLRVDGGARGQGRQVVGALGKVDAAVDDAPAQGLDGEAVYRRESAAVRVGQADGKVAFRTGGRGALRAGQGGKTGVAEPRRAQRQRGRGSAGGGGRGWLRSCGANVSRQC
jgi:hypothetical protein